MHEAGLLTYTLQPAFPSRVLGTVTKRGCAWRCLQQRELSRIYTGFPFNPSVCPDAENQMRGKCIKIISAHNGPKKLVQSWYSIRSPGWQFSSLHSASRVEKRIALALPVFKMDKLASVMPMLSARSLERTFRLAIITSRFTIIAIR